MIEEKYSRRIAEVCYQLNKIEEYLKNPYLNKVAYLKAGPKAPAVRFCRAFGELRPILKSEGVTKGFTLSNPRWQDEEVLLKMSDKGLINACREIRSKIIFALYLLDLNIEVPDYRIRESPE